MPWPTPQDRALLVGADCDVCGRITFPLAARCRNCGAGSVTQRSLPNAGIVETFSSADGVTVAEVRLRDGSLVFGQIQSRQPLRVGTPVEFSPEDGTMRFEAR